jgi:tetrapyrrole methylase family protein / MazG family protein
VLSDVKLALLDALPADHPVTVLQRLGHADERVTRVDLADLDRTVEPDHLTALFVDTGARRVAPELARLVALTERLRGPGGCPWDAKQTHHSLMRHTLEEAYEVADAISALPADAPFGDVDVARYDALEDELGDLLFQVCIHSVLAAETGAFTIADVAARVHAKLVHRHPHVFGDTTVSSADDVVRNWEQIKKDEQSLASVMDGVTTSLPALLMVPKLFRKAASTGADPAADPHEWLARAVASTAERADADAVADLLAAAIAVAWKADVDPEAALRAWAERFRAEFRATELSTPPE